MKTLLLFTLYLRSVLAGIFEDVASELDVWRASLGGCSQKLVLDPCFTEAAQYHANQMAEYQQLGYVDFVTGDSAEMRVTEVFGCSGFGALGIAKTFELSEMWVVNELLPQSLLLACEYVHVGIAYAESDAGEFYWALDFGAVPTTTSTTITSTTTPAPFPDDCIKALIAHANEEREIKGCEFPLALDPCMTPSAQSHSEDMVENRFFSSTSSDGTSARVRVREIFGCQHFFEEAIFNAYATEPEIFVEKYMKRSARRSKILDCSNVFVGIGVKKAATNASNFWTFDYGTLPLP